MLLWVFFIDSKWLEGESLRYPCPNGSAVGSQTDLPALEEIGDSCGGFVDVAAHAGDGEDQVPKGQTRSGDGFMGFAHVWIGLD